VSHEYDYPDDTPTREEMEQADADRDPPPDELNLIEQWLDEHGWDALDSPEFNDWLKTQGIDRDKLTIAVCRMPEDI